MSHVDSSEDDIGLQTPRFLRRSSRYSRSTPGTPPSSAGSSAAIVGPISQEGLQVWSQLPEAIKLDPSLAAFRREYEKVYHNSLKNDNGTAKMDYLTVNMAMGSQHSHKHKPVPTEEDTIKDGIDSHSHESQPKPAYRYIKLVLLVACWCLFTFILMTKREKEGTMHQISVQVDQIRSYLILEHPTQRQVAVTLEGALLPPVYANLTTNYLTVWLELLHPGFKSNRTYENIKFIKNISEPWVLPLVSEELIDIVPDQRQQKVFELDDLEIGSLSKSLIRMKLKTNLQSSLPVAMGYDLSPINMEDGIIYAAVVLLGLYILIIFEVVHRALAAMLASTMSVAILAALNERPTMAELISWIDIETLLLLFSMMMLVAIISETGIFDYLAVFAYKITGGRVWPLIHTLCIFTALISSFLDNVTTVLLMTPVTIRLCEVMELNPVPILMAMIVYSNIGGAITPVGDPPNVIIASNRHVIKAGVDFGTFTLHMGIGVIFVCIVLHFQLRFMFRDMSLLRFDEPQDVMELRHEIAIWQRAAASLSSYSKDEDLVRGTLTKKVHRLETELRKKLMTGSVAIENYKANLEELQEKYPIRDKWLLAKCGCTMVFVIVLFFLHSIPNLNLSLGWTALLGVLLLLVLADKKDLDGFLARVEWSTLIFFAALFILMEALSRLGFIDWIGKQTEGVILSVNQDSQLAVAILLILWVSALASAFVDNIPLTTMMIRIATNLAHNPELGLPLQPLVWALAFGACLGGNGTLIGASANVVCAGVAEQHGYRITFMQFFKVGFPIMLTTTTVTMVYLLIAHVAFSWNGETL
ncbi:P protein-like [Neodiprion virginianus]|uniref:P protein-like n=1 Tax=Neodiprion virginianus TaxID=2961670 RepID=UPI001EE72B28|nr:P protein-like [Neodiprion virginianus]XP_046615983.1 P protein-like [Neodiprion virginianus]